MSTLAWIFVLLAVLLARAVYKGRVLYFGQDLLDAFNAVVTGDTAQLKDVLSRSGDANSVSFLSPIADTAGASSNAEAAPYKGNLLSAAITLGTRAKGYRLGATGPDYYDCSGLVWQACKTSGLYTGSRFTTFTISSNPAFSRITTPVVGDIVCWPTHHMGVISGVDQFYSAESVKTGIGYAKISSFKSLFGIKPVYLRVNTDTVMKGL